MPTPAASPVTSASTDVPDVKMLSGGKWAASSFWAAGAMSSTRRPGQVIARVPLCSASEVDDVVKAAADAGPAWAARRSSSGRGCCSSFANCSCSGSTKSRAA